MKTMLATCLIGGIFGAFSTFADTLELKILDGEYWWAGLSSRGYEMPYDASTKVSHDLWGDNKGNQAQPLLLSNKGRYVWSEQPIRYEFNKGVITYLLERASLIRVRWVQIWPMSLPMFRKPISTPMVAFQMSCFSRIRSTIHGLS